MTVPRLPPRMSSVSPFFALGNRGGLGKKKGRKERRAKKALWGGAKATEGVVEGEKISGTQSTVAMVRLQLVLLS